MLFRSIMINTCTAAEEQWYREAMFQRRQEQEHQRRQIEQDQLDSIVDSDEPESDE